MYWYGARSVVVYFCLVEVSFTEPYASPGLSECERRNPRYFVFLVRLDSGRGLSGFLKR